MKKTFFQEGDMVLDAKSGRMSKKGLDIINTENPEHNFSLSYLTSSLSSYSKDAPLYINQNGKRILLLDLNGREHDFNDIKEAITISKQYAAENKLDLVISDDIAAISDDPIINNIVDSNGYRRPLFFSELERIADMGIPVKISLIGSDINDPISPLSKMGDHMHDINNLMLPNNLKTEIISDNKYIDSRVILTMYNKEDGCNAKMDNVSIRTYEKNNVDRSMDSIEFRVSNYARMSIGRDSSFYKPKKTEEREVRFPSINNEASSLIDIVVSGSNVSYKLSEQEDINRFIEDNPKISISFLEPSMPKRQIGNIIKMASAMIREDDKNKKDIMEKIIKDEIKNMPCSDKTKKDIFKKIIANNAVLIPQLQRADKIKNMFMVNSRVASDHDLTIKTIEEGTIAFINKVMEEQSEELANQYSTNETSPSS